MLFKSMALAGLVATASAAITIRDPDMMECGNDDPTPAQIAVMKQMAAMEAKQVARQEEEGTSETVYVDTYVHVVASSEEASDGYMSAEDVTARITALNDGYSTSGYQFNHVKTDWTVNSTWADTNEDEMGMKKKLRKGDYKTLNLYYLNFVKTSSVNGQCYFPTNAKQGTVEYIRDGCRMRNDAPTSTTVHETGHWFGLFHTFQGGCTEENDFVADTPQCKMTRKCPADSDTCPDDPGLDLVSNWMSYNSCRSEFTAGQIKRLNSQFNQYRA